MLIIPIIKGESMKKLFNGEEISFSYSMLDNLRIHAIDYKTKKVTLCGLGNFGVGRMEVGFRAEEHLNMKVCTGCIILPKEIMQFKKEGKLKNVISKKELNLLIK